MSNKKGNFMTRWGASPQDWELFSLLGLAPDLLPVVSNPGAPISPKSTMKDKGKTPSRYNKSGQVVGVAKWTSLQSTDAQVEQWSGEPDYGICMQTRNVRALDIDVPDPQLSLDIVVFINARFDRMLPMRFRDNSGKCLLGFRVPGEFGKRTIKVDGGMVEFLANGQQFIAAGTHPSGARYKWTSFDDFPTLALEQSEELWDALVKKFAIEQPADSGPLRQRQQMNGKKVPDETLDYLEEKGHVLSYGKEGQAFIVCPFSAGHSSGEDGDSSMVYFAKGSRGYDQGHFKCLHASCDGRTEDQYLDAIGYRKKDFEVVEVQMPAQGSLDRSTLKRDKYGDIKPILNNLIAVLSHPAECGMEIKLDTFRDEIVFRRAANDGRWGAFTDVHYVELQQRLERDRFLPISSELMRKAVLKVANDNQFDGARAWLEAQEWDGVSRIETFLSVYLGAADTPYTRAVALYMWTALAGRVMVPGIKADMVPILKGEQGTGKSTAIEALSPTPEQFCEMSFAENDDTLSRKMRGCLVVEIPELSGLRTRELESIKAFITKRHEKWVPKYKEFTTIFARRMVFFGTTNKDEILSDSTGNRRFLPFLAPAQDVAAIRRDCKQLWAEARELFTLIGVDWREAHRLAEAEHEKFMVQDALEDIIADWLLVPYMDGKRPADREYLRVTDIMREALGNNVTSIPRGTEMRISDILKKLGYKNRDKWIDGRNRRVWIKA